MMLIFKQGNIVNATEDIVVNAANGIGWMGGLLGRFFHLSGVAESIHYATKGKVEKEVRRSHRFSRPGDVFFTQGYGIGKLGIIHAVTMQIPGWWTKEQTVIELLPKIVDIAKEKGAKSIALPYLGCGTGHLNRRRVRRMYIEYFARMEQEVEVVVYLGTNSDETPFVVKRADSGDIMGTTDLIKIELPEGVTSIEDDAFCSYSNLVSVVIPRSVKRIGSSAFNNCRNLVDIVIPNGVESIGDCAFTNCSSLTDIVIPPSVISIGSAFSSCIKLKSIEIPVGVTSIEEGIFMDCTSLEQVHIPNGVVCIEGFAFAMCDNLSEIIIPSSVQEIGEEAFSDCVSLCDVEIPLGVTVIKEATFLNCSNLKKAVVPVSVTRIEGRAFAGCDAVAIYTPAGSYAEQWAKENGVNVVAQ